MPGLVAALLLLLVGYVAARLLRGAAVQALRGVDALIQRVYTPARAGYPGARPGTRRGYWARSCSGW
ncbi:MAG: hypothetical protein MZV65_13035 [Chromatiales bacterium]|nr:hypothetical protein [Chromatiales bacterium]